MPRRLAHRVQQCLLPGGKGRRRLAVIAAIPVRRRRGYQIGVILGGDAGAGDGYFPPDDAPLQQPV